MIQDSESERRARRATGGSTPDERLDWTLEANDAYQAEQDAAAEDERELGDPGA